MNSVLEDLEAHIRPQRFIDSKRLEASSYSVVNNFYTTFGSIIQETERALICSVDETMIETQSKRKAEVRVHIKTVIEAGYSKMPHLLAMLAANIISNGPPPFGILSELKNFSQNSKNL